MHDGDTEKNHEDEEGVRVVGVESSDPDRLDFGKTGMERKDKVG